LQLAAGVMSHDEMPNASCVVGSQYKKAQLSLTNPRDVCEKFARFT